MRLTEKFKFLTAGALSGWIGGPKIRDGRKTVIAKGGFSFLTKLQTASSASFLEEQSSGDLHD
jgi:hypothetical protein